MKSKNAKAPVVDLSIKIAGVSFSTPVWTASGTAGTGEEVSNWCDTTKLGAMVTKSVSLEPRSGHPYPRTCETAGGMLNAIGLQNKGVEAFISEELPRLRQMHTRVIVNIVGHSQNDYVGMASRLARESGIDMLEVNLSCPNVERGIDNGSDSAWVEECVAKVRKATKTPLIVKVTPNTNDIAALARAAERGGADSISAINTLVGMAVNYNSFKPRLSNVTGGLSGPSVKPVALACVHKIVKAVKIPVIGIGGISTGTDAAEFLIVGASAVQIGTTNFKMPDAPLRVAAELSAYLASKGMSSPSELIGRLTR